MALNNTNQSETEKSKRYSGKKNNSRRPCNNNSNCNCRNNMNQKENEDVYDFSNADFSKEGKSKLILTALKQIVSNLESEENFILNKDDGDPESLEVYESVIESLSLMSRILEKNP